MLFPKDKKGAELSMNVIIIVIILVIVLVVMVSFFYGGFGSLTDRIRQVGPDTKDVAVADCKSKCQLAQGSEGDNAKEKSSYCRKLVNVDSNLDGKVDQKHRCWSNEIGEQCPGVTSICERKYPDSFDTIE